MPMNPPRARALKRLPQLADAVGDVTILVLHTDGSMTSYEPDADTAAAAGTKVLEARSAAVAGETILVNRAASVTSTLAKNGVNWQFGPVAITALGTVNLWDDGGTAMSFSVGGLADFDTTSGNCVLVSNASSDICIRCRSTNNHGTGLAGVYTTGGRLVIDAADGIRSASYDGIWMAGGTIYATAPIIESTATSGGSNGLELYSGTGFFRAGQIRTAQSDQPALNFLGGTAWVDVDRVMNTNAFPSFRCVDGGTLGAATGRLVLSARELVNGLSWTGNAGCTMEVRDARIKGDVKVSSSFVPAVSLSGDGLKLTNCTTPDAVGGESIDGTANLEIGGVHSAKWPPVATVVTFGGIVRCIESTLTGTAVAGAVTLNTSHGTITTEALTTAAGSDYTLTLTNWWTDTAQVVKAQVRNGTNTTAPCFVHSIVAGASTITIKVRNAHASDALNGTLLIDFSVGR